MTFGKQQKRVKYVKQYWLTLQTKTDKYLSGIEVTSCYCWAYRQTCPFLWRLCKLSSRLWQNNHPVAIVCYAFPQSIHLYNFRCIQKLLGNWKSNEGCSVQFIRYLKSYNLNKTKFNRTWKVVVKLVDLSRLTELVQLQLE